MDSATIREQIERILNSPTFAGKAQLAKLLEVLFENMDSQLALKPDRVIRELWPNEVKTKRSADVATEMNRLRKALEGYYAREGADDRVLMRLPNRSPSGTSGNREKRWMVAEKREGKREPWVRLRPVRGKHATKWIGLVVLAIAASGVAFYRTLESDKQPAAARLDGSTLIVSNAKGEELWRKGFSQGFWPEYYSGGLASRMWFGDLEGKGHAVVLLLYHPAVNPISVSTTLICYSERGKEEWRWTPGRELPELEGSPPTYRTVGLGVLKATPNRPRLIVVSSYHVPFYPHQIALVDAKGKTVAEYWHSGHLDFLTLADVDEDGNEEIVAPGISNGYRQATLVVLDPDKVFGASTELARPEIQLHGMGTAQEKLRVLFPRSDLNKALLVYNQSGEASVDHGKTRLAVVECWLVKGCDIWYEFDKDFQLVSTEASDQFRDAHAEFYSKGNHSHAFTSEEEADFQKIHCLVGCKSEYVAVQSH